MLRTSHWSAIPAPIGENTTTEQLHLLQERRNESVGDAVWLSVWMPSSGSSGVAAIELFDIDDKSESVTVQLMTKKSDEADSGESEIGSLDIAGDASAGIYKFPVSEAQYLVRYRVNPTKGIKRLHFQFIQPLWAPN